VDGCLVSTQPGADSGPAAYVARLDAQMETEVWSIRTALCRQTAAGVTAVCLCRVVS